MAASTPCPVCGQPVPADQPVCPHCGASIGAPIAAPITAPMADVAGQAPSDTASVDVAAVEVAPAGSAAIEPVTGAAVPGAYLPPSSVHRPEPVTAPMLAPQMPLAASPAVGAPPPGVPGGWAPARDVQAPEVPHEPGRASLFADLPFDAPDSVTEWLVAVGSAVAALSFLLPWISGTVSYVTSWGLGSISRLPILAILVITAVLGILPNRVATWVRSGVLGLTAGSLLLGNIWPIVAGDYGAAAFGAIIAAAAALVLVVGGFLGVAPRRSTSESA